MAVSQKKKGIPHMYDVYIKVDKQLLIIQFIVIAPKSNNIKKDKIKWLVQW